MNPFTIEIENFRGKDWSFHYDEGPQIMPVDVGDVFRCLWYGEKLYPKLKPSEASVNPTQVRIAFEVHSIEWHISNVFNAPLHPYELSNKIQEESASVRGTPQFDYMFKQCLDYPTEFEHLWFQNFFDTSERPDHIFEHPTYAWACWMAERYPRLYREMESSFALFYTHHGHPGGSSPSSFLKRRFYANLDRESQKRIYNLYQMIRCKASPIVYLPQRDIEDYEWCRKYGMLDQTLLVLTSD